MQDTARATRLFQLRKGDAFTLWVTDPSAPGGWSNTGLGAKPCALLDLLMRSSAPIPRGEIADRFWGTAGHSPSRNSLRQALFRIRALIGADGVAEVADGLVLTAAIQRHASAEQTHGHAGGLGGNVSHGGNGSSGGNGSAGGNGHSPSVRGMPVRDIAVLSPRERAISTWLREVWDLARTGAPSSAWLAREPGVAVSAVRDGLAARCQADGGHAVILPASQGAAYTPFVLERELAAALLSLPGADALGVGHRAVLAQGMRGAADSPLMIRLAILELFRAVSREAPLLLVMEEPERYSTRALQELVSRLAATEGARMLLLLIGRPGSTPVSPVCLHPPA